VPLLKKPSHDVSNFNPFVVNPDKDTERTADVKNRLKERLERINIQNQLKNSVAMDQGLKESSLQVVKLNKIKKGDTSQIQKMEETKLTFHN
jgi:hypothetical protein